MESAKLNSEVWEKFFASPIYKHTMTLFEKLFHRSIGPDDLHAMGITRGDWTRFKGASKIIYFPFCKLLWSTKEGNQRCNEMGKQTFYKISSKPKIEISNCYTGLTEVAIPIIIDNTYCGCMSTYGGLLLHEPNETEWQRISEQVKDTGVNLSILKKAYFDITPISKEVLEIMLKLISVTVEEIVRTAIETKEYKKQITELEQALHEKYLFANIVGQSKPMRKIYRLLDKAIETDYPVVIQGETGTGKELIAKALHFNSPRKNQSFIYENCAAFAPGVLESELFGHIEGAFTGANKSKKGLFELADNGTLFLDEISIMDSEMQKKILRVLQEYEIRPVGGKNTVKINVKLIVATNKNLKKLVEKGLFREDLYYRLNVITINLPSLRERREDIPLLVNYFLQKIASETNSKKKILSEEAMMLFLDYDWPGNIRELQNEIKRLYTLTGETELITAQMISTHIYNSIKKNSSQESEKNKSLKEQIEELERKCIIETLQKSGYKKILCANMLGIQPRDLGRKIKRLAIHI
jgi:two-component system, NtrC family, response regulator HupR/HoxA